MSPAQFIAQLIWFGLFFASIGVAVDVTIALRNKAIEAHSKGPISAGKFTRMMTK